jgi:hypothetical protein
MNYQVASTGHLKVCKSADYNYIFDKHTGNFARWGATEDDDPEMAPCPEILDIEIATACDGVPGVNGKPSPCRFCYKANRRQGEVMSLDTFKALFAKLPPTVTQIAFGITNLYGPAAEHIWDIFEHTRAGGMVPNVTINGHGLTDEIADRLVALMGAVAVSRYEPKDTCYNAVQALTDRGMTQVNIHQLVSEETYEDCMEVLRDMRPVDQGGDPRLAKLNATVFLMLKPKGRGQSLTPLRDRARYKAMVDYALEHGLSIGFDSCSVPSFLSVVADHPRYKQFEQATDRCESGLFSLYIDVKGQAWPCSFSEDRHESESIGVREMESVDVLQVEDFARDVWRSPELDRWRARLCGNCRSCPLYDIDVR